MELKKYKHEAPYSYTLGMAPTLELIQCRPASVDKIYIHPNYTPKDDAYNIFEVCKRTHLPYEVNKKVLTGCPEKKMFLFLVLFSSMTHLFCRTCRMSFWSTPAMRAI